MATDPRSIPYKKPCRVFITNMSNKDYTPLLKVGELVPLTEGNVDIRFTSKMRLAMEEKLKDITRHDYLCISGNPVIAVEAAAIVQRKLNYVRYFFWESFEGVYVKRDTGLTDGLVLQERREVTHGDSTADD